MPVLPDSQPAPSPPIGDVQPWATVADVCAPCNDYGFDESLLESGIQMASEILFELTARRWPGEASDVVRPCGVRTRGAWGRTDYVVNGDAVPMSGWCGCNRTRACGCTRLSEIKLPGFPVLSVTEVLIDGLEVDPARYRVDDHQWLVYLPDPDGVDPRTGWPCCQHLDLPTTDDGTFSVEYVFGGLPDEGGVIAAASLGCQIALALGGDTNNCRLPKRVTTITRQGVTMALLDPMNNMREGWTGLPEVDLWIASKRLGAQRRRATVHAIGSRRNVRRAGQ